MAHATIDYTGMPESETDTDTDSYDSEFDSAEPRAEAAAAASADQPLEHDVTFDRNPGDPRRANTLSLGLRADVLRCKNALLEHTTQTDVQDEEDTEPTKTEMKVNFMVDALNSKKTDEHWQQAVRIARTLAVPEMMESASVVLELNALFAEFLASAHKRALVHSVKRNTMKKTATNLKAKRTIQKNLEKKQESGPLTEKDTAKLARVMTSIAKLRATLKFQKEQLEALE